MPLLRRKPFVPEDPPPNLKLDDDVFHCKLTNEIFANYEKFFERIILCNSLVWSCSITRKGGLTYQEAEESEERALKRKKKREGQQQDNKPGAKPDKKRKKDTEAEGGKPKAPKNAQPMGPALEDTMPKMTLEEIKALREKQRLEKLAQKAREREEIRRKFEEEKEKRRLERDVEREKKREEIRIQAELWREWSRHRDDLDCDDLKLMPEPTPINSRIPADRFGDALMVLEFVNCFSSIFDLKESFPKGFTLSILEEALLETDAGGLMADLLLMMLTAIFSLQDEEDEEEGKLSCEGQEAETGEGIALADMTNQQMIDAATTASHLPIMSHGITLRKLPLDNFTLTEILRLHILSSGAEANPGNAKFRYQQRGGYMPMDDAGLEFKRQAPSIVRQLAVENIYDLHPSDKLRILKMLVDQFLTYAASRDLIEDNYDKLKQARMDLKQLQWAEQRREKEEAALRYKQRQEERNQERERLEKRRLLKFKEKEQQLRKEGIGKMTESGAETSEPPPDTEAMDNEIEQLSRELEVLEEQVVSAADRERLQQEEDDAESDRKAEYMMKERDLLSLVMKLQHGNSIAPLGRDRMFRRYWLFSSVPGLFVEDDETCVDESALNPCSQNPDGSVFNMVDGVMIPPKLNKKPTEQEPVADSKPPVPDSKDGSDKENDSMNASMNTSVVSEANTSSLNISSVNNSIVTQSANTSLVNTSIAGDMNTGVALKPQPVIVENGEMDDAVVVISDDENSKPPTLEMEEKIEPPEHVETLASKQITDRTKHKWAFFQTEEDIEQLVNCLNVRGFRERNLKAVLLEQKNRLMETITQVPVDLLRIHKDEDVPPDIPGTPKVQTLEWRRGRRNVTGQVKNDSAHEGLELNLREMLLDLEERVHVGTLGYIRAKNRAAWRDAIENGSYDAQTDDPIFTKDKQNDSGILDDGDKENESILEGMRTTISVSKDLARALVQIERGIDHKYLIPPLGEDEKTRQSKVKAAQEAAKKEARKDDSDDSEDEDKEGAPKALLEKWEDTCLFSSSLSQVFLHLSSLEKAVSWSKSALHARCRICRRKKDPDQMLLCDICDRGHHMYCLKPPLKAIPRGDWFCPQCKPKETKRSPRKEKRRTFSQLESDESSDEECDGAKKENIEGSDDAEDEASSGEEKNDVYCTVCMKPGKLVCCGSCPLSFHLGCARPPLKKVPKGRWLCHMCSSEDNKPGKIKMNHTKGKKKQSQKPSSKQSSRTASPRDSPLTVKQSKKLTFKPVKVLTLKSDKKRKRADSESDEKPKMRRNAKSATKLSLDSKSDDIKHHVSSSRGSSKVHQLKLLEETVMDLIAEEESWPFLKPVVRKDAPDYYQVIKKPMDFSTIRNRINNFVYVDPAELVEDVRQMFINCIEYNKRTTVEFKCGANMSKLFERRLKDLGQTANGPSGKRARTK